MVGASVPMAVRARVLDDGVKLCTTGGVYSSQVVISVPAANSLLDMNTGQESTNAYTVFYTLRANHRDQGDRTGAHFVLSCSLPFHIYYDMP